MHKSLYPNPYDAATLTHPSQGAKAYTIRKFLLTYSVAYASWGDPTAISGVFFRRGS